MSSIEVDAGAADRALQALAGRALLAAEAAANAGAALVDREVKSDELRRTTHRKGEPTSSQPGQPPALVTGTLRRSMKIVPARPKGFAVYEAKVGPTVVYARIQELGGFAGRGRRTYLPARPYMRPVEERLVRSGELLAVVGGTFRDRL